MELPGADRRLLILDNAKNEEQVLDWLPASGDCHVLITSRFTAWSAGIHTHPIWVLDPEPADQLLLKRAGVNKGDAAVDLLAKSLAYLPLPWSRLPGRSAAHSVLLDGGWRFGFHTGSLNDAECAAPRLMLARRWVEGQAAYFANTGRKHHKKKARFNAFAMTAAAVGLLAPVVGIPCRFIPAHSTGICRIEPGFPALVD